MKEDRMMTTEELFKSDLFKYFTKDKDSTKVEKECEKHGKYYTYADFDCPACAEEATKQRNLEKKLQEEYQKKKFERELQDKVTKLFNQSLIPCRYKNATLDSFITNTPSLIALKSAAIEFIAKSDVYLAEGKNLLLKGTGGAGKTHLAIAIMKELINKQKNCVFLSQLSLLSNLTNGGLGKLSTNINEFLRYEFLVVDEIGSIADTYIKDVFFEFMNRRYEEQRSTCFITNLSKEHITKALGDKVLRRIQENFIDFNFFKVEPFKK